MAQEIEENNKWHKSSLHDRSSRNLDNFVVLALSEGPLTREDLFTRLLRTSPRYGAGAHTKRNNLNYRDRMLLDSSLDSMLQQGLLTVDEKGVCCLTDGGLKKLSLLKGGSGNYAGKLTSFMNRVDTAWRISLLVSSLLAALKLATGFIFNCLGLMADGFTNLMDMLSLMMASLYGSFRKWITFLIILIIAMLAAAAFVLYQAVQRLLVPQAVDAGAIAILIVVLSGIVCYIMSVYQGVVGRNSGSLSLVAQSEDSRRYILVAVIVFAGIICARFGIFIVDALVGLAIGLTILKSAIDLVVRVSGVIGRGEDFMKGLGEGYLRTWTLFILQEVHSKEDIALEYEECFRGEGLPIAEYFNFNQKLEFQRYLEMLLERLVAGGLVFRGEDGYSLTSKGRNILRRELNYCRYSRER
jgi:hypothetical protein